MSVEKEVRSDEMDVSSCNSLLDLRFPTTVLSTTLNGSSGVNHLSNG
jgi:hypothetical protein